MHILLEIFKLDQQYTCHSLENENSTHLTGFPGIIGVVAFTTLIRHSLRQTGDFFVVMLKMISMLKLAPRFIRFYLRIIKVQYIIWILEDILPIWVTGLRNMQPIWHYLKTP